MTAWRHVGRVVGGLALGCLLARAQALPGGEIIPNSTCLDCHSDKELTKTNAQGRVISLFVDPGKLSASVHRTNTCASCHRDLTGNHPDDELAAKPVDCAACHENQLAVYHAGVHATNRRTGSDEAAACTDCHGQHDVLPPSVSDSPLHVSNVAKTCGKCHSEAVADFRESIHGAAFARGVHEAPTCTDCHGEHRNESFRGKSSVKVAEQLCARCHASERINAKFHLPVDRVKTFFESYHGLAAQGGLARAANCASCHGYHKILPSSDPRSSIHPSRLVATCGKCHPGATENFALSRVHVDITAGGDTGTVINQWVRRIYLVLIFVIVGTLAVHNLLEWLRSAMAARHARGTTVVRMNRTHRIQHFILVKSFLLLALTGFALKYPDTWLAWLFGTEDIRRWLHRGAGVVLIGLGLYHVIYVLVTSEGRRLVKDLWPRLQDVKDMAINARYLIGRVRQRAKFGRYGYPEKLEYWAVVWGIIIMSATGLMVWFKMDVTRLLPRWIVDVALTVHYYEAILACLAIVVWHLYHVIFAPDVYPMNWAWWDGKVPKHWQREEDPEEKPTAPPDAPPPPRSNQE